MKVIIGGYEVEIKAKKYAGGRFNKEDTMEVLNRLSVYALKAEENYQDAGFPGIARAARNDKRNIAAVLMSNGFYK